MKNKNIENLVKKLTNETIDAIYLNAKKWQNDEIELGFNILNTLFTSMTVYFPADDEEFETDEDYCGAMLIDVNTEYTDNDDGLVYKETTRLDELDLTALLKIYETIED